MRVHAVPAPLIVYGTPPYAISWWRSIAIAFLVLMAAVLVPAAARADCGLSELRTQQANLDAAIAIPMTVDDVVAQARTGAPPPRLTALTKVGWSLPVRSTRRLQMTGNAFLRPTASLTRTKTSSKISNRTCFDCKPLDKAS